MDKKCEYDGTERRKQCDMVVALNERHIATEQRFQDFLVQYEYDKKDAREFRSEVRLILKDLQDGVNKLRPPVRAGIWIGVTAIGASIITAVGFVLTKIFTKLTQ